MILNDTDIAKKLQNFPLENRLFKFCVGVWVGGYVSENIFENAKKGNPQRQRAAEMLLQEKFKPILISYNS